MGNLLLTFPDLAPASFRPWVNEADAREAGPLARRVRRQGRPTTGARACESGHRPRADPGAARRGRAARSTRPARPRASRSTSIGSLKAPPLSWDTEAETLRDEIEGTVTSLLGLVGIAADPLSSREHVLLANLVEHAWRAGRDLDLGTLIGEIQTPPLRKLGVFELDAFFPPKDRTELALTAQRARRLAVVRRLGRGRAARPGSCSSRRRRQAALRDRLPRAPLRARSASSSSRSSSRSSSPGCAASRARPTCARSSYMDEVFGFVPPTAAPPAKKPILTILKQGRAFGVGHRARHPEPGRPRLQGDVERRHVARRPPADRARQGARARGAPLGGRRHRRRRRSTRRSAALQKRQFLLVSAHEPRAGVFTTRWAMSYLRGPLTKEQIATLDAGRARARRRRAAAPAEPRPSLEAAADAAVAPAVAAGVPVSLPRPRRAVGRRRSAATRGLDAAARVSRRPRQRSATTTRRRASTSTEEFEAVYGPLDSGPRPRQRDAGRLRRPRLRNASRPPAPPTSLPQAPARRGVVLPRRATARSSERLVDRAHARALPQPRARSSSRARARRRSSSPRAATRRRRRRPTRRPRRSATGWRRSATGSRSALETGAAPGRGARGRAALAARRPSCSRAPAPCSASLLGGRGRARTIARAGAHRHRRVAPRDDRPRRRAPRDGRGEGRGEGRRLEELEQEILDEVAEIDERWDAQAKEIETVAVRPEATDVRIVELALVWVPTT